MIHGRKESGYYVTADGDGHKIEGETRQCIHCQYLWEYGPNRPDPFHKTTRGYCIKHQGFICCRPDCVTKFGLAPSCTAFEDEVKAIAEKLSKGAPVPEMGLLGGDYTTTQSGLVIKH